MGCAGAWSLHPSQIDIAKKVFSPDPAEVAFAQRILEAMPDGTGAVMIDGKMQDDATWKQAKVIVDLARSARSAGSGPRRTLRILIRLKDWRFTAPATEISATIAMRGRHLLQYARPTTYRKGRYEARSAKYTIGQVVRHRVYPFRGVVFDVDPTFDNTEEWWQCDSRGDPAPKGPAVLPSVRGKRRDRVCRLRVRAEPAARRHQVNPIRHPQVAEIFEDVENGVYRSRDHRLN